MHIEKRRKGGKVQYYLAHSYRKGGKVMKMRAYLGDDLSDAQVEKKRKAAEEKVMARVLGTRVIRDPYRMALSPEELKELGALESKGRIRLIHLSEEEWLRFSEAFTYSTNAIEGSSVTGKEVADILERNKWPEKPKEEISETYGVAEAVAYVRKTKEHVSLELMKELHRIVFRNSKRFAGRFRGLGSEVAVVDAFGNVVHRGAPSSQVASLLKELVAWYRKNRKTYSPLVLAAVVHNQFENIHPFEDGNGRVGRLLLINILIKHGFPPLNIEMKNRREYYAALQAYEKEQNLRPTVELMLREYRMIRKGLKRRM